MNLTANKVAAIAVLLLLSSVSNSQQAGSIWSGVYSADQARRGEVVYTETCLACHGQDLGGNSNSPSLKGMSFMFLWEGKTLGEFYEKIRSEMPTDRPGQLSTAEYLSVVAYILEQNSFPAGVEELPSSTEALNAISILPKP